MTTSGLEDFRQRRLILADLIRALLPVAHRYQDEPREREVRALLARLAAGRFQLAVAGQFSRGKTTLMNALLGGAYLPTGALPMTSVVTTVRYGARPRALVRSRGSDLPMEVPVADAARFVAQASADRSRLQVASVDVEIPAELLRLGFEFVDTPGVGSAVSANTATTLHFLPQADAIIFVTGFDSVLTQPETEFLAGAARQAGRLFLVVNKRDLVDDAAAREVTHYVERWGAQNLGQRPVPVFALSALRALEAVEHTDRTLLAASGIAPFRSALVRFLTAEQGTASLRAVATTADDLLSRQRRDLLAGAAGQDQGRDARAVADSFDARMREVQERMAEVTGVIAAQVTATVPGLLADRRAVWREDLHQLLSQPGPAQAGTLQQALSSAAEAGHVLAPGWLDQQAGEIREALIASIADRIGVLTELAGSPRDHGARLASLPVRAASKTGWTSAELPALLLPAVPWDFDGQSAPRWRRRDRRAGEVSDVVTERLTAAVENFADRAGSAIGEAARDWAARLCDDAARKASEEAAAFRRYLSTQSAGEDLAVVDDLTRRLAEFGQSLSTLENGTGPDSAGTEHRMPAELPGDGMHVAAQDYRDPRGTRESCQICARAQTAVTDYLIDRQLRLAVSEDDQARLAEAGGFCPLHTWQYAQLASPAGISAGYASLAGTVGAALAAMTAPGVSSAQLASSAGQLAGAAHCAVCAVLSDAEHEAAAAVLPTAVSGRAPAVCLRHLALAVRAGLPDEAAAAVTGALAGMLTRGAQDMRSYALKREALRRGLITADEADAYRRVLRLLAGWPALALPWEADPDAAPGAR